METVKLALILLVALEVKHVIADFTPVQTTYMLQTKGDAFRLGGYMHAAVHVFLSFCAWWALFAPVWHLFDFTVMLPFLLKPLSLEFVWHWLTDLLKSDMVKKKGWGIQNYQYWVALGVDQFSHQCCYILMVWYLMTPLMVPGA